MNQPALFRGVIVVLGPILRSLLLPIAAPLIGLSPAIAFTDTANHWAQGCITELNRRGFVTGYPDGSFRPETVVTRAEAAVLMLDAFREVPPQRPGTSFLDVPTTYWAHRAIQQAYEKGFFTGYPGQVFRPNQAIPRVQALAILVRNGEPTPWPLARYYDDADQIPTYAQRAIALATRKTYVVNHPQRRQLRPNQATTRGEMAAFLCRALNVAEIPPQYLAGVTVEPYSVRSLPGQLNASALFNSNSPELLRTQGILLSTLPKTNQLFPDAHLDYAFDGQFGLFSHHIARAETAAEVSPPFYQGILLHNPGQAAVTVQIRSAVSYVSNPEAPFIALPDRTPDPEGKVFSGPGDRASSSILRGLRQLQFPEALTIPPGEDRMLLNQPMAIANAPASNGRSTLMRLFSDGPVYVADLALRSNQPPTLADWQQLLKTSGLAQPRDAPPTPLDPPRHPTVFSRVAGVSQGDRWVSLVTDQAGRNLLTLPSVGQALAYPIGTLHLITLSTNQIQSAPMLRRYPDTALFAHSNYGVEYDLTLPLHNATNAQRRVAIALESPLKDEGGSDRLLFLEPQDPQIFFRGTVKLEYEVNQELQTRYVHLVQRRGQRGEALLELSLAAQEVRSVRIRLIYPPDATPPQVLTVRTLE